MTHQQAYETMRAWLARPGATRAVAGEQAFCLYLTPNHNRCAIGALLSPDAASEAAKCAGGIWSLLEITYDAEEPLFPLSYAELAGLDVDFLWMAQLIHDTAANWDENGLAIHLLDQAAWAEGLDVVEPLTVPSEWKTDQRTPALV